MDKLLEPDIVERLRSDWRRTPTGELQAQREEAADAIDYLRKVIAELEERVAEDDARWSQITVRTIQGSSTDGAAS